VSGQKKRNDEANGDVVSADRSAPPQGQGSPKKISLKVIDESSREMVFSVSPSTKLRKLMMNYSKRLELDVSCFKFIFDGRRILEDETVKQLEMEDGDTINVVSNVSPMVTLARDHDTEIQLDKSTLIRDRPSLPDSNDNIETKSSSQTKKEGMEHAHKFRIGDLVWVFSTIKENPPLPGKICMPPQDVKRPPIKHQMHCVQFFGGNVICWIEEFRIKDYYEQLKDTLFVKNKPTKQMSQALQSLKSRDTKGRSTESEEKEKSDARVRGALPAANKKLEKSEAKKREANDSDSSASGPSSTSPTKRARVTKTQTKAAAKEEPSSSRLEDRDSASPVPSFTPGSSSVKKSSAAVSGLLDRPTLARPASPSMGIDLVTSSQTLREKDIQPSKLNFGFLGLGIMGSGMVKNLLNSGHNVSVWNRTTDKVRDFVEAGAKEALTPSDVIADSDITFSCVADPQAAKDLVFGNCGVLQEINTTKGYVEMTGIDSETSQDIAEAISLKGGRYLEAQIQGSKTQAQDGTLVLLVSGDRSLFDDCQSCFQAMGKNSFYLGEVGNATKMNLVLQTMMGVTLAGLAEGMALADRAGLQQKDVLEVLELTGLACPILLNKGKSIIDGGFPTHQPLQHMQKDLKLSLNMGDTLEQPLPLTASANEVFKHAKRLGYGEHDVSAVYIRARF